MSYRTYNDFGFSTSANDPLTYLLNTSIGSSFIIGHQDKDVGKGTKHYRDYFSDRCALTWDGVCQAATMDTDRGVPVNKGDYQAITFNNLSQGDLLLRDIAEKKYLRAVSTNSTPVVTQYDLLVPTSPFVSSFNRCTKRYGVDPDTIDTDPVMDKLIDHPEISPSVLLQIFRSMTSDGTISTLNNTKLGRFYGSNRFHQLQKQYK